MEVLSLTVATFVAILRAGWRQSSLIHVRLWNMDFHGGNFGCVCANNFLVDTSALTCMSHESECAMHVRRQSCL